MTPARDALVEAARDLVGLTEPSDELGQLVDPAGSPEQQAQIQRLSLCELTWRGLVCSVLDVPAALSELDRPYVPGSIPRILASILASAGGARRVPTLAAPPQPGDGILYGAHGAFVEHVDACVVETAEEAPGVIVLSAVAGGQRDGAGHQTIALVPRRLRWDGARWVCQATGRPVVAVLDADALADRYGLRAAT